MEHLQNLADLPYAAALVVIILWGLREILSQVAKLTHEHREQKSRGNSFERITPKDVVSSMDGLRGEFREFRTKRAEERASFLEHDHQLHQQILQVIRDRFGVMGERVDGLSAQTREVLDHVRRLEAMCERCKMRIETPP